MPNDIDLMVIGTPDRRGTCVLRIVTIVRNSEYFRYMVNPALQPAIEAMSLDERLELVKYVKSIVEQSQIEMSEEQKSLIRSGAADLQANPSPGLTWEELDARMGWSPG